MHAAFYLYFGVIAFANGIPNDLSLLNNLKENLNLKITDRDLDSKNTKDLKNSLDDKDVHFDHDHSDDHDGNLDLDSDKNYNQENVYSFNYYDDYCVEYCDYYYYYDNSLARRPDHKNEANIKNKRHRSKKNKDIDGKNTNLNPKSLSDKKNIISFPPDCNCGFSTNTSSRIYKGNNPEHRNKYPFAVYITFTKKGKPQICTGSIIHENFILTAAHCFLEGETSESVMNPEGVKVYVGDFSRSEEDDIPNVTKAVPVDKIIVHEGVNLRFQLNDIALVRLSEPLNFLVNEIKPICLPRTRFYERQGSLTSAGWGASTPTGKSSKILQEAKVYVSALCVMSGIEFFIPSLLCVKGSAQISFLCKGDSGGPVMRIRENGRYELVGIVSFSVGTDGQCAGTEGLTVLTNVYHYMEWILSRTPEICR